MKRGATRPTFPALIVALLVAGLLPVLVSACATGLGPKAVRSERPDYNHQIRRSGDAEMLLNLVRLRYNDSPQFLDLGTVVAQYGYDASLNASGTIGGGGSATIGTGLGYTEKPTITYTPLTGDQFATRMLTPIPLDSFMLFEQTGWSGERLLLMAVQRVNDLFNAPTASGPTPKRAPDYEAFADFADRFHRLQQAGLIGLNWEMHGRDTDPPGRNPRFWLRPPPDPRSPLATDVAALRRALDLEPGSDEFLLTAFPFRRQPGEVGIRAGVVADLLDAVATSVARPRRDHFDDEMRRNPHQTIGEGRRLAAQIERQVGLPASTRADGNFRFRAGDVSLPAARPRAEGPGQPHHHPYRGGLRDLREIAARAIFVRSVAEATARRACRPSFTSPRTPHNHACVSSKYFTSETTRRLG